MRIPVRLCALVAACMQVGAAHGALPNEPIVFACYFAQIDIDAVRKNGMAGDPTKGDYRLLGVELSAPIANDTDKVTARIFDPNSLVRVKDVDARRPSGDAGFVAKFGSGDRGWTLVGARAPGNMSKYVASLLPNHKPKKANEDLGYLGNCGSDIPAGTGSDFDRLVTLPVVMKRNAA
ncbi:MAG: hypothetical protein J7496_14940 [Novosphingobium sp.]|nr:hypothetical protein [Novosphingobium sp.]MBO9603796.1 hypothetical protein [Novosphingobium sp.]